MDAQVTTAFPFIQENPAVSSRRKPRKRDRRVDSCDQCRDKRVKCVDLPVHGVGCKACIRCADQCTDSARQEYRARQAAKLGVMPASTPSKSLVPSTVPHIHSSTSGSTARGKGQGRSRHPYPKRRHTPSPTPERSTSSYPTADSHHPPTPYTLTPTMASTSGQTTSLVILPDIERSQYLPGVNASMINSDGFVNNAAPAPIPHSALIPTSMAIVHTAPTIRASSSTSRPRPIRPSSKSSGIKSNPYPTLIPTPAFDPHRLHYPHPTHMYAFLHALKDLGSEWKGLDADNLWQRYGDNQLSPILANAVAGFAARYAWGEMPGKQRYQNGQVYLDKAKELLCKEPSLYPTLENLYALVFMAWSAYGSVHQKTFFAFGHLAISMLQELDTTVKSTLSSEERMRLTLTWFTLARLDSTMSWLSGQPMRLKSEQSNWVRATAGLAPSNMFSPIELIASINRQVLVIRTRLQNIISATSATVPSQDWAENELREIRSALKDLVDRMPLEIRFTLLNLRAFVENGRGTIFVQLHLSLHTFLIMANTPTIFNQFTLTVNEKLDVSCISAEMIVAVARTAKMENFTSISAIPCLDLLIGAAAWSLLKECRTIRELNTLGERNRRGFAESQLEGCIESLKGISSMFQNLTTIQNHLINRTRWEYNMGPDEGHLGGTPYSKPSASVSEWVDGDVETQQQDLQPLGNGFPFTETAYFAPAQEEMQTFHPTPSDWIAGPQQFDLGCSSHSTVFDDPLSTFSQPTLDNQYYNVFPNTLPPVPFVPPIPQAQTFSVSSDVNTFDFPHAAMASHPLNANRYSPARSHSSTSCSTPLTPQDAYCPSYAADNQYTVPPAAYVGNEYLQTAYMQSQPQGIYYDETFACYKEDCNNYHT